MYVILFSLSFQIHVALKVFGRKLVTSTVDHGQMILRITLAVIIGQYELQYWQLQCICSYIGGNVHQNLHESFSEI